MKCLIDIDLLSGSRTVHYRPVDIHKQYYAIWRKHLHVLNIHLQEGAN